MIPSEFPGFQGVYPDKTCIQGTAGRTNIRLSRIMFGVVFLVWGQCGFAQDVPQGTEFLKFVRSVAVEMRAGDTAPLDLATWQQRRTVLRSELQAAWGGFPEHPAALEASVLEVLDRPDYRIEKIIFQTFPGIWMTANAWIPKTSGRHAAVLCVHGHWPGAKQDPHVQARCAGLAKLGFFVLAVDAFGAGERAIGKALGEYHGEMAAATLWPVGLPLSGLQVYENLRAVDYLITRPEVDPERIGITGASGGGNQSMYAGAWDERLKAVVPVCSVGNYQAYLGAACCMCEVVPGALTFTEEAEVLALVAPRALMVVSATRDAFQFSVQEARKSIEAAQPVFQLYDRASALQHAVFESGHDYNQPMREAMYGFMALHLQQQGDGSPIPEPAMELEEPETLRCFPGDSRPDDWLTLPGFAAREAREVLKRHGEPESGPLSAEQKLQRRSLLARSLGIAGSPPAETPPPQETTPGAGHTLVFSPDPGIQLELRIRQPEFVPPVPPDGGRTLLVVTAEGSEDGGFQRLQQQGLEAGLRVAALELRATGRYAWPSDRIGRAPDHNTAEWSLWIGRPLLGQWVCDIQAAISCLSSEATAAGDIVVTADGPAALAVLTAAALDQRISAVRVSGLVSTLVTEQPYQKQRLGMLPNGLLRDVGDVLQIAVMVAPTPLTIHAPVTPQGDRLSAEAAEQAFRELRPLYQDTPGDFSITTEP